MLIKVRRNIFETNSSSIHAIAIKNKFSPINIDKAPKHLTAYLEDFGWEEETYRDCQSKLNYLYTNIMNIILFSNYEGGFKSKQELVDYINNYPQLCQMKNALALIGCKLDFAYNIQPNNYNENYTTYEISAAEGCVDHPSYLEFQEILDNPVLFLNYLFNKHSYLRTSNDNGGDLVYLDKDSHRKDFQFYEKCN